MYQSVNIPTIIIIAINLYHNHLIESDLGDLRKSSYEFKRSNLNTYDEAQVRALFPLATSQAGPEASRMAVNLQQQLAIFL